MTETKNWLEYPLRKVKWWGDDIKIDMPNGSVEPGRVAVLLCGHAIAIPNSYATNHNGIEVVPCGECETK